MCLIFIVKSPLSYGCGAYPLEKSRSLIIFHVPLDASGRAHPFAVLELIPWM